MTKAQLAALVLSAFGAGAGVRSLATAVSSTGADIEVQSVCAAKQPDAGYALEVCGYVTEKGGRPRRVCDRHYDPRVNAMVKEAPSVVEKADAAQAAKRAETEKKLAAQRRDAGR